MSFITTTKRVVRYGILGFFRNGFVSLSAILIMMISLFVGAILIVMGAALNSVLNDLTNKVDITVYMAPNATEEQITTIRQSLQTLPEVSEVIYVSREDALAAFQEAHKNDHLTLQALQNLPDNPLGSSLEVRAKDTSQYNSINKYLEDMQATNSAGIDRINFPQNKNAIDRLTYLIYTSRQIGLAIAIILAAASLLIAFNTIRLAIYIAREEISVMNLVGASHWFVRGPFVVTGFLYGLLASVLVFILLYPLSAWLGAPSERFFGSFNVLHYFTSHFFWLFGVIAGTGIVLGSLSSFLAVRRYLR